MEMSRTKGMESRREHHRSAGVATWKLVVILIGMVTLGALGAITLENRKQAEAAPGIDYGFSATAEKTTSQSETAG